MNPADEMAAELVAAVAGSDHTSDEHASLKDFKPTSHQRPVEDLHNLLLRISHHLDYETSERKANYHRLLAIDDRTKRAIESLTKRRASRAFVRYLIAICIGVAGTLAWQSYGESTKQIIATTAPELGWSPEAKQMIASWVQQLGWTKPLAGLESAAVRPSAPQLVPAAQVAPETVASKAPAVPSLDTEQVQQIALALAALRQSVEQIAGGQDQMAREIARLQAADVEILERIPAPQPQPPSTTARKPIPTSPSSRAKTPPR